MIRLEDTIQIFQGAVYPILGQQPFVLQTSMAFGYEASLLAVMDEGGEPLTARRALRRKR